MDKRGFPSAKELAEYAHDEAILLHEKFVEENEKVLEAGINSNLEVGKLSGEEIYVEAMIRGYTNRNYAYNMIGSEGDSWPEGHYVIVDCFKIEIIFDLLSEKEKKSYLRAKAELKKLKHKLSAIAPYVRYANKVRTLENELKEERKKVSVKMRKLREQLDKELDKFSEIESEIRARIAEAETSESNVKAVAWKLGLDLPVDGEVKIYSRFKLNEEETNKIKERTPNEFI